MELNKYNNPDRNFLLIVTMAANFFNPFMGAAVNVALKKIGSDFDMNAIGISWVTMSFLLASAIFLVPFGRLGDIWGRSKMFMYGNIFFTIATLLAGLSINGNMMITMRFIQGITAAMMTSTTMALVISAFPPSERGKVIGFNVSAVYIGSSLAPMIGGYLTDTIHWRSIFIINAVTSAIISIIVIWKLRKEWSEVVKEKFDYKGSVIFMAAISMLMYGFSKLPDNDAIILTILGLIGLFIFAKVELKMPYPVLEIRLFTQNRVFALSNFSALINYAATFAISFMLSLYLQYVKGLEAREAGLVLIAQPVVMAIVASFSGRLSDKKNPKTLSAIGMGITTLGLLILSFIQYDTSNTYIISGLIILGAGFGMFSSPNTNVIMSSVEPRVYGTASATLATMRTTGMMFSMAIATLTIHLFLGNAKINPENIPQFVSSTQIVFIVFTILCFIGVFTSMTKPNKK